MLAFEQVISALLVLSGIAHVLSGTISQGFPNNQPGYNALFLLGIMASAIQSVFSEHMLKTWDGISLWRFAFLAQALSVPLLLPIAPLYTLFPSSSDPKLCAPGVERLADLPIKLADGFRCFLNKLPDNGSKNYSLCSQSAFWLIGAVVTNMLLVVSAYYVLKRFGAATVAVVSAASLPLSSLVFNLKLPNFP